MPLDQQVSTLCRLCRQRAATYDFVGEEMPEGVRRIRCRGCGNETWLIKLKPFRCGFGRTFYPDGSIGPRESATQDPDPASAGLIKAEALRRLATMQGQD